jgi:hypothetical protein
MVVAASIDRSSSKSYDTKDQSVTLPLRLVSSAGSIAMDMSSEPSGRRTGRVIVDEPPSSPHELSKPVRPSGCGKPRNSTCPHDALSEMPALLLLLATSVAKAGEAVGLHLNCGQCAAMALPGASL